LQSARLSHSLICGFLAPFRKQLIVFYEGVHRCKKRAINATLVTFIQFVVKQTKYKVENNLQLFSFFS